MAGQTLLSTAITNIDANPPVRSTAGKGAAARPMTVNGYVSPGATDDNTSIYRLVRVPSNCTIKQILLESHGTITTLTGSTTLYYSDAPGDYTGISTGKTGLVNSLSGSSALFANATAMATVDTPVDVTNKAGNYSHANRNKELWDAAGLSSDPGGFFDIVFTPTSTNSLTAGATIGATVMYTSPAVG